MLGPEGVDPAKDEVKVQRQGQRGDRPRRLRLQQAVTQGKRKDQKDRGETEEPGERHARAALGEPLAEPGIFQQQRASEGGEHQRTLPRDGGQAEHQGDEEQRHAEELTRVGQVQFVDEHPEQHEGQGRREPRQVRQPGRLVDFGAGIVGLGHKAPQEPD